MKVLKMSITPIDIPEEEIKEKWLCMYEYLFDMTLNSLKDEDDTALFKIFNQFTKVRKGGDQTCQ